MTESNFTPGPWSVDKNFEIVVMPEPAAFGTGNKYVTAGGGNNLNNLFLIAAAPELYHALKRCVHQLSLAGHDRISAKIIAESCEALKKARGES